MTMFTFAKRQWLLIGVAALSGNASLAQKPGTWADTPPARSTRAAADTSAMDWSFPQETKIIHAFHQAPGTERRACEPAGTYDPMAFVKAYPRLRETARSTSRQLVITATRGEDDWVSVPEAILYRGRNLVRGTPYTCNGPGLTGYKVHPDVQ